MSERREKDAKSTSSDAQEQIGRALSQNEAVAAAMKSLNEKVREAVQQSAKRSVPQFEELGKEIAARLLEEHRQRKIDAELLNAGIRWIESKWGDQPCPYCQHIEWQVGTPVEITASGEEVMSPAFPVMCGNCGHTTFVNAVRAGLLDEHDEGDT